MFIPKVRRKAWSRYEEVKEHRSDMTGVEQITDKIMTLAHMRVDVAATVAMVYLTGSRISELIRWKYKSKYSQEAVRLGFNVMKPGFQLQQLTFYKDKDKNIWWNFKTINLKQNSKKSEEKIPIRERCRQIQATNYKELMLPAFGELPDMKLIKFLDMFFESVLNVYREDFDEAIKNAKPNSFINPFKESQLTLAPFGSVRYQTSYHYITNYLDMTPHNLRELRMQHLLRVYKFDIQDIHIAGGWSKKSSMPLTYTRSKMSDIQAKFMTAIARNPL